MTLGLIELQISPPAEGREDFRRWRYVRARGPGCLSAPDSCDYQGAIAPPSGASSEEPGAFGRLCGSDQRRHRCAGARTGLGFHLPFVLTRSASFFSFVIS